MGEINFLVALTIPKAPMNMTPRRISKHPQHTFNMLNDSVKKQSYAELEIVRLNKLKLEKSLLTRCALCDRLKITGHNRPIVGTNFPRSSFFFFFSYYEKSARDKFETITTYVPTAVARPNRLTRCVEVRDGNALMFQ